MSDREERIDPEFESWLEVQVPSEPSEEVDARILAAGRAILAERSAQRRWPARRVATLAAAALFVAVLGWMFRHEIFSDDRVQRLDAAGGGYFEVTRSTAYEHTPLSSWLRVTSGRCDTHVADAPLDTAFPGGVLRIERGHGSVAVLTEPPYEALLEEEAAVQISKQNLKRGSVVVVLTLAIGWGVVEFADEPQPLAAGAEQVLIAEPDPDQPGQYNVRDASETTRDDALVREGRDADSEKTLAESDETTATDDEEPEPRFRGQVIDALTGAPLSGVRVGWVDKFVPEGVGAMMVRNPKANVHVGNPTGLVIEGETVQLPFVPGPATSWRKETTTDDEGFYELTRESLEGDRLVFVVDGYQPGFDRAVPEEGLTKVTALEPSTTIVGTIETAHGRMPIGEAFHASCQVVYDLPGREGWSVARSVLLSPDFTFEVDLGVLDEVRFRFQAAAYEDYEETFELRDGVNRVKLVVADHPHLTGRVVDIHGQPIEGANLLVKSGKRSIFGTSFNHHSATTNENGEYIAKIYGSVVELSVDKEGYAPAEHVKIDADRPFDITMQPVSYGRLVGRVTDERGVAVPGAAVRAVRQMVGTLFSHPVQADDDGFFAIEELAAGTYRVTAERRPEATPTEDGTLVSEIGVAFIGTEKKDIVVAADAVVELEFEIRDGGTVTGVYRDADGRPQQDVRVTLYKPDLLGSDHEMLAMVSTDEEGRYLFGGVPNGTHAVAVELLGKYKLIRVGKGREHIVDLGGETSTLRAVVYRRGEVVADSAVAVGRLETGGGIDSRLGKTDTDGRFELDGLVRGRNLVHIRDAKSRAILVDFIEVTDSQHEIEIHWPTTVLTLDTSAQPLPVGSELQLELVAIAGIPLEGVVPASYLKAATATTTSAQVCTFVGVSAGRYRVWFGSGDDRRSQIVEVPAHSTSIAID